MPNDTRLQDRFWDAVCRYYTALSLGLSIAVALLILSLFSFLVVDPNSASYVIVQVDIILLTVGIVVFGFLLYGCANQ